MKKVSCLVALCVVSSLGGSGLAGCGHHSYAPPVVVMVPTGAGAGADVAWIVEDGGRIVRCTNGPERPQCVRAEVH
jgi:hypothetical protein